MADEEVHPARAVVEFVTAADVGLPDDDEARLALAQRTAMILLILGSSLAIVVIPLAALADVAEFQTWSLAAVALGGLASGPVVGFSRLSWRGLQATLATVTVLITFGVFLAGGNYALGAVLYLWVCLFAFLFFSRAVAVAFTALVAVEYGLVVSLGEGFQGPVGWWLFLVGTAAVTGVVLDWLVSRTRALALAERATRVALEAAHAELAALNHTLEARVTEQVDELESLGQLRRFLSPQVADAVLERGHGELLEPHRRDITVFFCDLRGFTAFTAEVEPEEVLAVLAEYYDCVGTLFRQFEATIGPLSGDGVMAYFNDPIPCEDPIRRAVDLALAVSSAVADLSVGWERRGHDLGCGIGIASGFATLGLIGFEGKRDYGPMGSVVNRASRLCDAALRGQTLVDATVQRQLGEAVRSVLLDTMELKGFPRPVPVYLVDA